MSRKPSNYEIGYGRPPEQHRFSKGQSGNPNGRPRTSKPLSDVVSRVLNKQIPYREGDFTKRGTAFFVLLNKLMHRALKDDPKAIDQILKLLHRNLLDLQGTNSDTRNGSNHDSTLQVRQKIDALIARAGANKNDAI